MKTLGMLMAGLGLVVVLGLTAFADDKKEEKEVTLKGSFVCGKCELKMTDACSNAIKVTEKVDGKDTVLVSKTKPCTCKIGIGFNWFASFAHC